MPEPEYNTFTYTEERLAAEVMDLQWAVNLSGIVHSMSRAATELREVSSCSGTDWVNRHPVMVMYASKIAALTNCEDTYDFRKAMEICEKLKKRCMETGTTSS